MKTTDQASTCIGMSQSVETDLIKIGRRLKEIRLSKGYSCYRQFADAFDFEPKNICGWKKASQTLNIQRSERYWMRWILK